MQAKLVDLVACVLLVGLTGVVPGEMVAQYDEACKDPVYGKSSTYCLCLKDKNSDACKCGLGDKAACERAYPTPRGKGGTVK
jgi:hypothetical protein